MGEDITANILVLQDDQLAEDIPLDLDAKTNPRNDQLQNLLHARTRRSSSEAAPEFFEFLNDNSSYMCPADHIIFGGKLIPLKQQPLSFQTLKDYPLGETSQNHVLRKQSESLSELRSSIQNSTALLRNSRSLDYQKQKIHRSEMAERNVSTKRVKKSEVSPKKVVKPRWYVFIFGMVKFPPEMELKDIKSRQFRRNPSVMFPDDGKKLSDNRSSDKSSSWCLLKALSCRDYTSVAVTSSFYMSQA